MRETYQAKKSVSYVLNWSILSFKVKPHNTKHWEITFNLLLALETRTIYQILKIYS